MQAEAPRSRSRNAQAQQDKETWQVDLGRAAVIDKIMLWNREDTPADESLGADYFSKRLFPCYIMVSQTPFPEGIGTRSLENAFNVSVAHKKFSKMRRKTEWELPTNTVGRYVRVQLTKASYLHFAELEIFGQWGVHKSVGHVDSVDCAKDVTVVVIKAMERESDVQLAYKRAAKGDPLAASILRQFATFYNVYESK